MKCTIVKKSSLKGIKGSIKAASKTVSVVNFQILDNEDDTFTIQGTDSAGNALDISGVATLTDSSSDVTTAAFIDPPAGMVSTAQFLKPTVAGSPVVLTFTATWTDGSVGPFTITVPVDITGSVATGLIATPGVPTVR